MTLNATRPSKAFLYFLAAAVAACVAIAAYTTCAASPAYAVTSAEKQEEADAISANISELQTQINARQAEYNEAEAEHERATQAADEARERVAAAKKRIAELQVQLGDRVSNMYKTGGYTSFLDVIFGATSFQDFVTILDAYEAISGQDAAMVQDMKDARAEAEAAQAEAEAEAAKAVEAMQAAETAKQELETTQASMQTELDKVNEEVAVLMAREEAERLAAEEAERRRQEAAQIGGSHSGNTTYPSGGGGTSLVSGWVNPCPGFRRVSCEMGSSDPNGNFHNGIDLAAAAGTPIYAAKSGTVSFVGWYGTGGKAVIIEHGGGLRTIYMHMSDWGTTAGTAVNAGDLIGYVGSTGFSTGPHLHFQVEVNRTPVNPRHYLNF